MVTNLREYFAPLIRTPNRVIQTVCSCTSCVIEIQHCRQHMRHACMWYFYLYSYRRETARQLRMYAQLTRCFSAVAELLVVILIDICNLHWRRLPIYAHLQHGLIVTLFLHNCMHFVMTNLSEYFAPLIRTPNRVIQTVCGCTSCVIEIQQLSSTHACMWYFY